MGAGTAGDTTTTTVLTRALFRTGSTRPCAGSRARCSAAMAASQELHPAAAALLPFEERLEDDVSYFRKLGVKYEADALIDLLKREKPKSAMPVACHSLADLNARHAVPVLKTLADYPVEDVKATSVLAVARLAGSEETAWLVECLSRKGTLKSYVLWALAVVGDPAAYVAVR